MAMPVKADQAGTAVTLRAAVGTAAMEVQADRAGLAATGMEAALRPVTVGSVVTAARAEPPVRAASAATAVQFPKQPERQKPSSLTPER